MILATPYKYSEHGHYIKLCTGIHPEIICTPSLIRKQDGEQFLYQLLPDPLLFVRVLQNYSPRL